MDDGAVRKRRTREHVIASLSVNFVERQALLCGDTVERVFNDYGYDLFLFTFDENGEVENGAIPLQIKASDAPDVLKRKNVISLDVARSDIILWLTQQMPVILVMYDARADKAYWLYTQRYFANLPDFSIFRTEKTVTVHIPKSNVLNQNAIKQFAGFRDRINKQTSGRVNHNE